MGIGINGFGRIGRTAFRVWHDRFAGAQPITAINTSGSMEIADWVHLLKYDSNYGVWPHEIVVEPWRTTKEVTDAQPELGKLRIGAHEIVVMAQRDPAKIPWAHWGTTTVIESTGRFVTQEDAQQHLQGGAQWVVLSAPAKGDGVETVLLGVSQPSHDERIISNASCTTNCVAPVAAVMEEVFGVKKALMTTVHAYTDDQNLHDNSHRDLRRARAAAKNIVPTTTGAARTVGVVSPEFKGKFDGLSVRVPVATGSLSDIVFVTSRPVTAAEVNLAFEEAAKTERWQGILAVTHDPIVSSDIIGRPESSIVDLALTQVVDGDLVKVVSWYDNEWGYCNRLVELAISLI